MKKAVIILLLVFLLSCVNVDMTPRVNLSKSNISVGNQSITTQTLSVSNTSITNNQSVVQEIKTNISLNISTANNSTNVSNMSIVNTSAAEKQEAKLTSSDFEIFFPKEDYRAKGDLTAVSLKLINFSIGVLGEAEKPNVGLFKYSIDNQAGFKISDKATFTVSNLTKGKRTLTIEMIGTNMTSFGVKKNVTFQAQAVTEGY